MEDEADVISSSSSTSSSVTPNEKCVLFPRIRKLLKRFTIKKQQNVIDSININLKNTLIIKKVIQIKLIKEKLYKKGQNNILK